MRLNSLRGLVRSALSLALVAFSAFPGTTQTIAPQGDLRLRADFARFRGDEKNMFVEVYYSIPQHSITYKADDAGSKGGVDITLMIMKKDSMVYADRWVVPHMVKDTSEMQSGVNLVGLTSIGLPEGEYTIKMIGRDRNDISRKDSLTMRLPLKMVGDEKMVISDIELATSVKQQGNKASPFYKNTLEVVPSPEGVYSEDQRLFYYAEAYNLLTGEMRGEYVVKTVVFDAIGREVISRERVRKRSSESSVLVDNVSVEQFRSGTYTLAIGLLDSSKKVMSSTGKKFYVYNRKLGIDSSLNASVRSGSLNEYTGVEEPELDREFEWARYEATDTEKGQFKALKGAETKRRFLADFWQRRPAEFKQEYLKRVAYANATFSILQRQGYLTDRGRVYIMYGPPSDNDRHPNESDYRPYEVWTFQEILGGVVFAFVQRSPGGDYELVHSTHRNELHDENWMQYAQAR
jgi:GWxTD domain-containing protein